MRRAARTDANHEAIVQALRAVGCSVQSLAAVGGGCVDLLVGYRGRNHLLEVKAEGGSMTADQRVWHAGWAGDARIVLTIDDALLAVGATK